MCIRDSDLIDWSDLDSGITWTRGAWTRGDRNLMELRDVYKRQIQLITGVNPELEIGLIVNRYSDKRIIDRSSVSYTHLPKLDG